MKLSLFIFLIFAHLIKPGKASAAISQFSIKSNDSIVYLGKQPDGYYSKVCLYSEGQEMHGIYIGSFRNLDSSRLYFKGYFRFTSSLNNKEQGFHFSLINVEYSYYSFSFDSSNKHKVLSPLEVGAIKFPVEYSVPHFLTLNFSGENLEMNLSYLLADSAFDTITFHPVNK